MSRYDKQDGKKRGAVMFYSSKNGTRRLYKYACSSRERALKALEYFGVPAGWYEVVQNGKRIWNEKIYK